MKIKLLLAVLMTAFTFQSLTAQDVGVYSVSSIRSDDFNKVGMAHYYSFTFENYGTSSLPGQTLVPFNASYKARSADEKTIIFEEAIPLQLSSAGMAPGQRITISPALQPWFDFPLFTPTVEDTFEVCFWMEMQGDVDNFNDTSCIDVFFKEYIRDFALVDMLPVGQEWEYSEEPMLIIDEQSVFGFTIKNESAEAASHISGPVNVIVIPEGKDSVQLGISFTIGDEALQPQGERGFNFQLTPSNLLLPGAIPVFAEDGRYDICFRLNLSKLIDPNKENNTYCRTFFMIYSETLSMPEFEFVADHINVFPNPANAEVNFKLDLGFGGDVTVNIYDLSGRLVHEMTEKDVNAGEHTLVLPEGALQNGSYIYRVQARNQSFEGKLMVH